jgi:hypothetical protein
LLKKREFGVPQMKHDWLRPIFKDCAEMRQRAGVITYTQYIFVRVKRRKRFRSNTNLIYSSLYLLVKCCMPVFIKHRVEFKKYIVRWSLSKYILR